MSDLLYRLRAHCDPESDEAAAELERLTADYAKLYESTERRERDKLRDVLIRHGFVECDIAACNCGSWHPRYGLPERMAEIKDALAEAGHPLTNKNGHLVLRALQELIAERDSLIVQTWTI